MTGQKRDHLNRMLQSLPPGLLVDSAWLQRHGISRSRVHDYVRLGWLERLMPRVYRRPPPTKSPITPVPLRWELAVVSAQALVEHPFHVGGSTALDLLGLSHFLDLGRKARVCLHDAAKAAPRWLAKLPLDAELTISTRLLFEQYELGLEWHRFDLGTGRAGPPVGAPTRVELWDHFLFMSGPERATIEMLEDVGTTVGFHSVDNVFQSLANLRPALLMSLLKNCRSVKAKRLFFFFADRHDHAWRKRLESNAIDLGSGKRQIVSGGRLDRTYQITVPSELLGDGAQHGN